MITQFEGCKLAAYLDQKGIPTVCVGHTGPEVKLGMTCTPEQCDAYLQSDLATAEETVNRTVTVTLSQNQFDALVSLTFNIGPHAFAASTVLRKLNGGSVQAAADAFLLWDETNHTVDPGLLNRRTAERQLFLTDPANVSPSA